MRISSYSSGKNMDNIYPYFTVRTLLSLFLLILLRTGAEATICSAPLSVQFPENNNINDVVVTIDVEPNVTLEFNPPNPDNPFAFRENMMIATMVLDYENKTTYVVQIMCKETTTGLMVPITVVVLLINENDNPPVFDKDLYNVEVSEMAPIGTTVGVFPATDLDKPPQLYYVLTSEYNYFRLQSATIPAILVNAHFDYEKVKNVQLILQVQDTPLTLENNRVSFTTTTTIEVTILDGDNRPPWFQPCTTHDMGGAVICQSTGYTGNVVLDEQKPGVLPLKPGPLYAIDGDSGINEEITYSFLSGNDDGLFEIGPNTGNITMLKPADVLETISLTVLATQKVNTHQFATTTVTISVQIKSLHPPKFQKAQYEGVITSVGTMAMDMTNKDQPLHIIATDQDYSATEGLNPHITYSIKGSSDFSIINGYLFMTKDLPEATLSLEVLAVDSTNDESDTALLSVEVKSGLTTSSLPQSTTDLMTTTPISESTTNSSISSASPSESTIYTTNSVISLSGEYGVAEMAALGATLGALLLICLVVIGVLAHRMQRGKADWRKIYEATVFRSSLGQGPGGQKEGIQYTNEAFQNDDDGGSMGSSGPEIKNESTQKPVWDIPNTEAIKRSSAPLHDLLTDDTSDVGSDKADSEKEVKPILTKERRMEEGYKSVWFREDIDPNAKEDVVIIPDREEDSEEEDEEPASSRQNDQDVKPPKTSKVLFSDTDLDSGLGVKIGELGDDSDTGETL